MVELATPRTKPTAPSSEHGSEASSEVLEPRVEYVNVRQVRAEYDKAWLADEADVERYLEAVREALLEEIRKGKRVQV
jgi:hypothetical protein